MFVKQLSVFIENRAGRLEQVTEVLKNNEINIVSLSLADTSEYGLLRMIVSDPAKGKAVLRESGFSATLTDVVAVRLEHKIGMLQSFLKIIRESGENVEYMYALATGATNASMIVKTSNPEKTAKALIAAGMQTYGANEAYCIND